MPRNLTEIWETIPEQHQENIKLAERTGRAPVAFWFWLEENPDVVPLIEAMLRGDNTVRRLLNEI